MTIIEELLAKKKLPTTPIWLMRQAGRYMPEYREIRSNTSSFLEMCYTPKISAEITMQPIRKFDFDAAIIFSDILVIPHSLGLDLDFIEGQGPVMSTVSNQSDFKKLNTKNLSNKLKPIYEAIIKVRDELDAKKSLIGFAGAPWTLLSYMLEGNSSKNFMKSKVFVEEHKGATEQLIDILIESISEHLVRQIESGANVVQIFDSWAGCVADHNYNRLVIEPTKKIVEKVKSKHANVPVIGFPRGSSFRYEDYAKEVGVDILSIDQQVPLNWAVKHLKKYAIIQGNLDPCYLFSNEETISAQVEIIKNSLGNGEFIFNLGHGVLPTTPIKNVEYLVREVRKL